MYACIKFLTPVGKIESFDKLVHERFDGHAVDYAKSLMADGFWYYLPEGRLRFIPPHRITAVDFREQKFPSAATPVRHETNESPKE